MVTPELLQHIRDQMARGVSRVFISQELLQNGWRVADINDGFNAVGGWGAAPKEKVTRDKGYIGTMISTFVVVIVLASVGYWVATHLSSLPFISEFSLFQDKTYDITPSVVGNAFAPVPEYQSSGYTIGGVTYGSGPAQHTTQTYTTYVPNPSTNTSVAVAYIPPTTTSLQTSVTTVPIIPNGPVGGGGNQGGGGDQGGGNGGNPPPPPPPPEVARLSVSGSQILDPSGNPILLRGWNWGDWGSPLPQDAADNVAQGANYIRVPLSWYFGDGTGATNCGTGQDSYDPQSPQTGYINPTNLAAVDQEVQWAGNAHIWVDLMVRGGDCDFWTNPAIIPQYLTMWQYLANHFKDTPYIGSYEILSEPHPANLGRKLPNEAIVKSLAITNITAIRAIDPRTPIVVGPAQVYDIRNIATAYMPGIPGIIYTANFFELPDYVKSEKGQGPDNGYPAMYGDNNPAGSFACTYPNEGLAKKPVLLNKTWLAGLLTCATSFRDQYNVPIYINQVGLYTSTKDSKQYVTDVLGLFDQNNLNWTWWTYRARSADNNPNSQAMLYQDNNGVWQTKQDWITLISSFF